MTMSSDQYETGNSSVKISDGAKGSTVEVKVYAKPIPENERITKILDQMRRVLGGEPSASMAFDAIDNITAYIRLLRHSIPNMDEAQKQVNAIHLKTTAMIERNGGMIAYDPDKRLLAAWEQMEEHDAEAKHA